MDTSKEYIKMCRKAKETQRFYYDNKDGMPTYRSDFIEGDFRYREERIFIVSKDMYGHIAPTEINDVWLPRQDQLQEMVKKESGHLPRQRFIGLELCNIYVWYQQNRPRDIADDWVSMEQLWLAFVMKERYSKQWTGEDWEVKP